MLKDMAMPENNDILSLRQVAKEINKVLDSESGQIKTLLKKNQKCTQNTQNWPKLSHYLKLIFWAKIQLKN